MSALRVGLGIRNSHNPLRILTYAAWAKYAKLKSGVVSSRRDSEVAAKLRSSGIAMLGVSNVEDLAQIVDEHLAAVPIVNGYAPYPRERNSAVVPHLYALLQEHRGAIEAYFGSHFRVNWFEVQRIAPGSQAPGSSFGYHTDDTPHQVLKMFVYLNDTYESNGAFRAFEYQYTDELLRRGMLASVSPGEPRAKAQSIVPPDWESKLTVVEGVKGTVFLFDNNLIHKGTLPRQGMRTHVSMELMPSTTPLTEESMYVGCDEPITEYFPTNPFSASRRERVTRVPLRSRIKRIVNKLGYDILPYDSARAGSTFNYLGPKAKQPRRIIIGGGDHVYGSKWHNIEYVTAGYADKYKSLPRNIDIAHDLTSSRTFPIADATVVAAYTSHVIEHLKDEHVEHMFRETHRVLSPGGYFRISCPNIDLFVRAFLDKDLDFFHYRHHPFYTRLDIHNSIVGLFLTVFASQLGERIGEFSYDDVRAALLSMGVERALDHYSAQVEYDYSKSDYHVNWFNPAKLTHMLSAAGFKEVYISGFGQSFCPEMRDINIFDRGDPKISLFVECRK